MCYDAKFEKLKTQLVLHQFTAVYLVHFPKNSKKKKKIGLCLVNITLPDYLKIRRKPYGLNVLLFVLAFPALAKQVGGAKARQQQYAAAGRNKPVLTGTVKTGVVDEAGNLPGPLAVSGAVLLVIHDKDLRRCGAYGKDEAEKQGDHAFLHIRSDIHILFHNIRCFTGLKDNFLGLAGFAVGQVKDAHALQVRGHAEAVLAAGEFG